MKVVILEDEFRTRNAIISIIERNCSEITLVGWADSVEDGKNLIKT
jgi:YesN/AraC family two-component response regulator